jgi:hypothetical protein
MRLGGKNNDLCLFPREKPPDTTAGRGGSTNPAEGREYPLEKVRIFA